MNKPQRTQGLTLLELLVGMTILGVLMLAFTQVFGGSLRASGEINARNELLNEGQIAQQLIASRLQSAYYIYPPGTTLQLTTSGSTTPNTIRAGAGQNWIVGTDPIAAMIVPPRITGSCPSSSTAPGNANACFTFYAYYPIVRGTFISTNSSIAPSASTANADTWILMEYRANLFDGVNRNSDTTNCTLLQGQGQASCPPNTGTVRTNSATTHPTIRGRSGQMLVDYVQPQTLTPTYTMFGFDTANGWVDLRLRLLQNNVGKAIMAPAGADPLSTRVYPRNLR